MHVIRLHKGREQSVLRKHPWIFSGAIQPNDQSLTDGDTVWVEDNKGNAIGTGHYQNSSLSVRLFAFEKVVPDVAFWKSRIEQAAQCRKSLSLPQPGYTDAFRLVHGEGDQLPGLIVDVYNHVAVIQAHSIGMYMAIPEISSALLQLQSFPIKEVYSKSKDSLPANFAQQAGDGWVTDGINEDLVVHESGIKYFIDVVSGQKTGFFLDQRENRSLVRSYAFGKEVLNGFCYTGGFSLAALAGGAKSVVSVDSSAAALDGLSKNISLNAFQGTHESIKENVLTYLGETQQMFDIVIMDPPAFAKSMAKRHNAVQAYKRLNILAMKRVKPGGLLFTFSCSQVVDKPLFQNTIVSAAMDSGRPARILHELSQGPDHPVSAFHPEGHYLKGLVLYLE